MIETRQGKLSGKEFQWVATFPWAPESPHGFGSTKEEAITDLVLAQDPPMLCTLTLKLLKESKRI